MENKGIRVIYFYEFDLGRGAWQTAQNLTEVFVAERVQLWLVVI
jgi:hypothetical protein